MTTVPQRLKELRKKAKLNQADIAKFLNISESAYGYYEQGRNEISISSVQKLAKKYNVSVAYILGETDYPTSLSNSDDEEFQSFINDPSLEKWYKELPKSKEEDLRKLRKMWEILKDNGEV